MDFEHYEGAPRKMTTDRRSIQEVLRLHIFSAESMRDTFRRMGQRENVRLYDGIIAGLEAAIGVADFRDEQTEAPKKMTATICHTLSNGRSYRQCLRCMMRLTASGEPDPDWYSSKRIAYFRTISSDLRCDHNKTTQINVTEIPGNGETSVRTHFVTILLSWNVKKKEIRALLEKFDEIFPTQARYFEPIEKLYDRLKDWSA